MKFNILLVSAVPEETIGNSSGGIYYMSPNTVTSHTMYITAIKAATYVTITGVSDDWGFKITTTDASYRVSVLRLS